MDPRELLKIAHTAENLKNATRHCFTSTGRHESVAEHSWRISFLAYFLQDEFPEADMNKVITMCLFHDMGEAFTGDIPAFEKTGKDEKKEEEILMEWVNSLPAPYNEKLTALYQEMEERRTLEAKIYKALDKMEALISHNESDVSTWLPLEYDLQYSYGQKEAAAAPFLQELHKAIDEETDEQIREAERRGIRENKS